MGKKYIKCPRCELNYILEGEDYCHVCKSEMKHHTEPDEDLLDFDDMELCPICGQNYIREDQTMCDECRGKSKADADDENGESAIKDWKNSEDDDSLVSADSDIDRDEEEYNSGFSDIDPENYDLDAYKTDDDTDVLLDDKDEPIDFALDDEETEEDDEVSEPIKDDFETVDVSDDDIEEDEEDEDDDYDIGDEDLLGKKK